MNKGNFPLFSNWLKQFTSTVFLQSFHAVFLMFTMVMLFQIQEQGKSGNVRIDGVLAVVAVACAMALIKFEKMIKKLFGIEDSPVGNTAGAGAKMFMGARSAIDIGKSATSGFKKSRDANKNLKDINEKRESKKAAYKRLFGEDPSETTTTKKAPSAGVTHAEAVYNNTTRVGQTNNVNSGGTTAGTGTATGATTGNTNTSGAAASKRDLFSQLEQERRLDEINDLEGEEMKARKAIKASNMDKYLNVAGAMASISVGLGAADEMSESITIANILNKPIDRATDKFSNAVAGRQMYNEAKEIYKGDKDDKGNSVAIEKASKLLESSITSSIKSGLQDYTSNMHNKSAVKLTVDQVTKYSITKEVNSDKKDLARIRKQQKEQADIDNV